MVDGFQNLERSRWAPAGSPPRTQPVGVAAVTGATGYLGGAICSYLRSLGWEVIKLVRSVSEVAQPPKPGRLVGGVANLDARFFDLSQPVPSGTFDGIDLLVHAAYDLSLTAEADIWRVNIGGTRSLLDAATHAGITRILVLSSMSAYQGTTQIYGRAKLVIEDLTRSCGGCSVRPGLVYGDHPGGMAGALQKLALLPIVPVPTDGSRQYPVHEDDFLEAIGALVGQNPVPVGPIGIASPDSVSFKRLIQGFGKQDGHRMRFIPVPWFALYSIMRIAEGLNIRMPVRSDSILGLVRPAPSVPGASMLSALGVVFRSFPGSPDPPGARAGPEAGSADQ